MLSTSFGSKQSFGKAVKKVTKCLPQDPSKRKLVIQAIAESIGLIVPSFRKRTTRQVSRQLKDAIGEFYCRDDISYQMPGKRDSIVVRQNGTKSTHQKRILLYNIREVHHLFLSENAGSGTNLLDSIWSNSNRLLLSVLDIARTSFPELRPEYVLIKALMSHRVCVCAYHENVNLLLEALKTHIKGDTCFGM